MEELLTGELADELSASIARAGFLLDQLTPGTEDDRTRPDPNEMGAAAIRTLALPEIAELRPHLKPEIPVWGTDGTFLSPVAPMPWPSATRVLTPQSTGNRMSTRHSPFARRTRNSYATICLRPMSIGGLLSTSPVERLSGSEMTTATNRFDSPRSPSTNASGGVRHGSRRSHER